MWVFWRKQQPTFWRTLAGMGLASLFLLATMPATTATKESSLRSADMNTLRQIGLASFNYESTHGYFPPLSGRSEKLDAKGRGLSWRVHLLPFLEEG